jgi:hypothetical protein
MRENEGFRKNKRFRVSEDQKMKEGHRLVHLRLGQQMTQAIRFPGLSPVALFREKEDQFEFHVPGRRHFHRRSIRSG